VSPVLRHLIDGGGEREGEREGGREREGCVGEGETPVPHGQSLETCSQTCCSHARRAHLSEILRSQCPSAFTIATIQN